jgi:hypothetical protein
MSKQENEVYETLRWAARFAEGRRDLQRQTEAGSGLDNPVFNAWIERCNRCLASMGVREDGRLDEEVKEAKDA